MSTTRQIRGPEFTPGFTIGRPPLWLRGIRCADEGDGGNGGVNPPAPAPPAPAPAPAPVPTPPAPQPPAPASQPKTGPEVFSREYVHDLREEAKANRLSAAEWQAKFEAEKAEREKLAQTVATAEAEKANAARLTSVTAASENLANPELLMDSDKFKDHIAQVNLSDTEALKAKISEFVEKNPHYKLQPALPGTSGGTPGAGNQNAATTLEGAIAATLK